MVAAVRSISIGGGVRGDNPKAIKFYNFFFGTGSPRMARGGTFRTAQKTHRTELILMFRITCNSVEFME